MDKLLVLRGLAALAVVAYHCQNYIRPHLADKIVLFGKDFTWLFVFNGYMAVIIFFTLSGYLMFKAFIEGRFDNTFNGALQFYYSRAKRIFPLYYFLAVIFLVLLFPKLFSPENISLVWHVLTFTYSGDAAFVPAFWSLSVEVQFYILMPLIFYVCQKYLGLFGKIFVLMTLVAFSSTLRLVYNDMDITMPPGSTMQLMMYIDAFLIGGAAAYTMQALKSQLTLSRKARRILMYVSIAVGCSVLPLASLYSMKFGYAGFHSIGPTLVAAYTAVFILAAELSHTRGYAKKKYTFTELLAKPWLLPEFLGAISYGVYLWHGPVVGQSFVFPVSNPLSLKENLLRIVIVSIVCIILAYLTYKYVEGYRSAATFTEKGKTILAGHRTMLRAFKKASKNKT